MTVKNTSDVIIFVKDGNKEVMVRPGNSIVVDNDDDGVYHTVKIGPIMIFQKQLSQ